jgi:hypothetical protein
MFVAVISLCPSSKREGQLQNVDWKNKLRKNNKYQILNVKCKSGLALYYLIFGV